MTLISISLFFDIVIALLMQYSNTLPDSRDSFGHP